jgi:hypothetical protein
LREDTERIRSAELTSPGSSIPQISYSSILANSGFAKEESSQIRSAGCCIIRGTLPEQEVVEYNDNLTRYIVDNGYYETVKNRKKAADEYFTQLDSSKPQIFGIYWSPAQIWARQHPNMTTVRNHLNRLWSFGSDEESNGTINPDRQLVYADRIRRREPGDASLGLSPHVDSGSIERWIEPNYRSHVYRQVFGPEELKDWRNEYDAFQAFYRMQVEEFPSPAVCSVFRSFQGWVALTEQGRGDGTLQLFPSTLAMPYMLLRALQDDVTDDDLCGAAPGRALTVSPQWHPLLFEAETSKSLLVSIPTLLPGDTVWWHPDTIHAVEDLNRGSSYSNVIYVAAVPDCEKNRKFLPSQQRAFLSGESCRDFAPENHEVTYKGRATLDDLTPLGREQMGFDVSDS